MCIGRHKSWEFDEGNNIYVIFLLLPYPVRTMGKAISRPNSYLQATSPNPIHSHPSTPHPAQPEHTCP